MKTLLLNPPSFDGFDGGAGSRYQSRREVHSFWYPTWLCSAAGLIPESRVLDAPAAGLGVEDTLAVAKAFELVAIYTSAPGFRQDVRLAERIKAANPGALIGFVGPHPTALPEETLKASPAIDFVTRGEFDYMLRDIAAGADLSEVVGLSYRQDGRIVHNGAAQRIENLDDLPFVVPIYKRDLDIHRYDSGYLKYPYLSFYTGRGCVSRCTFCLWPQTFSLHTYRVRSVDNIVEEVKLALKTFPEVKEIFFDDDTLTDNRRQVRELAARFKPLGFTWSANSKVTTDYDTLKAMRDGGLRLLVVGYESGNQQILKNVKKGTNLRQAREFTKRCQQLGIVIHGTFIVGLPGETRQTIEESIAFAKELNPDSIQVSLAAPYPGTEFYQYLQEHRYLSARDLVNAQGYQEASVAYPWITSAELQAAVERFYKAFYFRPRVILRILGRALFDGAELRRRLRQGAEFRRAMRARAASTAAGAWPREPGATI
jgi:hopanoid biosynthesis associated radical SAM protein HpnJ